MSAIVEPPTPTPPRTQKGRTPRSSKISKSLHDSSIETSLPPRPKRRNRHSEAHTHTSLESQDDLVSPLTPPRLDSDTTAQLAETSVSPISTRRKNGRAKKGIRSTSKDQNHASWTSTQHPPRPHSEQPQGNATPLKQASQMYAGPTFHASPAPSSLPLPKFFSKPATSDYKSPNSDNMSPDETSSHRSTSESEEQSPTLRNLQTAGDLQAREPSPLDIFFKADREEKARLSQKSPPIAPTTADRAKSASPLTDSFKQLDLRPHVRRQTESAYSVRDSSNEDVEAKTAALKKLLLVPQAQKSSPVLATPRDSPMNGTATYLRQFDQTPSGSSTPASLFGSRGAIRSESSLQDSPDVHTGTGNYQWPRRLPFYAQANAHHEDPRSKSRRARPIAP